MRPAYWGPAEDYPSHAGGSALQQLRMATYEDVYAFGAIMVEVVTGRGTRLTTLRPCPNVLMAVHTPLP